MDTINPNNNSIIQSSVSANEQLTLEDWMLSFGGYDANGNVNTPAHLQNLANALISIFTTQTGKTPSGNVTYNPVFFGNISYSIINNNVLQITLEGGGITQDGHIVFINNPVVLNSQPISNANTLVYAVINPTPIQENRIFINSSGNTYLNPSTVQIQYNLVLNNASGSDAWSVYSNLTVSAIPLYWVTSINPISVTDVVPYLGNPNDNLAEYSNQGIIGTDSNASYNNVYSQIRFMLKSILQAFAKFKGVLPQNWYQNVIANIDNTSRDFSSHINKSTDYPSDHQNSIELIKNSQGKAGMLYPASNQEDIGAIFAVPDLDNTGAFRIFKGLDTIALTIGLKLTSGNVFNGFKSLTRDSNAVSSGVPGLYFALSNYSNDDPSSDGTNVNPRGVVPTLGIIRSDGTRLPLWYDCIKSAVRLYYIVSSIDTITISNNSNCIGLAPDVTKVECLNVSPPSSSYYRQYFNTSGGFSNYNGYATAQSITTQNASTQSVNDLPVYFSNGPLSNIALVYGQLTFVNPFNSYNYIISKERIYYSFIVVYPYIQTALNNNIVNYGIVSINGGSGYCLFPNGQGGQGDVFFATAPFNWSNTLVSRILVTYGTASPVLLNYSQINTYQSYIGLNAKDINTSTITFSNTYSRIDSVKFTDIGWVEVNLLWVPKP